MDAKGKIQIDRFSDASKEGTSVAFLDDANTHLGWKITLAERNAWVQYDRVDFGNSGLKSVNVRSLSSTGGTIEIHLDKADGPLLARLEIKKGTDWSVVGSKLVSVPAGVHPLPDARRNRICSAKSGARCTTAIR